MARLFNLSRRTSCYAISSLLAIILLLVIRVSLFESTASLAPVTKLAVTLKRRIHYHHSNDAENQGVLTREESNAVDMEQFDWDEWVSSVKHFQSIGDIWDKCDNTTRRQLGKVVLAPNVKSSGFHIEVFVNVTVGEHNITDGSSELEVKYKGLRLYTKAHKLCVVTKKMDNPLSCPFLAGSKISIVDSVNLPSFIPKGDYAISAIIKDQEKREIGCVSAAFKTGGER